MDVLSDQLRLCQVTEVLRVFEVVAPQLLALSHALLHGLAVSYLLHHSGKVGDLFSVALARLHRLTFFNLITGLFVDRIVKEAQHDTNNTGR